LALAWNVPLAWRIIASEKRSSNPNQKGDNDDCEPKFFSQFFYYGFGDRLNIVLVELHGLCASAALTTPLPFAVEAEANHSLQGL
jgi:hypothetical protein